MSDSQWQCLGPILAPCRLRPRKYEMRLLISALFYLTKTGCQWRSLPPCFPPWQVVYYYFRRLGRLGIYWKIIRVLREQVRVSKGKKPSPSVAIVDSQSVKTSGGVSKAKGWDGAKKLKGRKRHLFTDTLGLPLAIKVGSAATSDRAGFASLIASVEHRYSTLKLILADRGYWGLKITDIPVRIVERPDAGRRWKLKAGLVPGQKREFKVVPKRWIVERSFGWLTNYRRLARDYEKRTDCATAFIMIAFIAIMMKNLTHHF
jgi:putative transposase